MSDTELAQAVKDAAKALNEAILAAENAGLRVELAAQPREELDLYSNIHDMPRDDPRRYIRNSASVSVTITRAL